MSRRKKPKRPFSAKAWAAMLPFVGGLLLALVLLYLFAPDISGTEISYTEFKQHVGRGDVAEVTLRDGEVDGRFHAPQPLGAKGAESIRFNTRIPALAGC